MHVAGRLAVDRDDLVAHGQPGARGRRSGRDGDDPGQDMATATSGGPHGSDVRSAGLER